MDFKKLELIQKISKLATKIGWTSYRLGELVIPGATFNPWIGCTKWGPGCLNCYAEREDNFRKWTKSGWGKEQPRYRTKQGSWDKVKRLNKLASELGHPVNLFCASLADVFDEEVQPEWRRDLFRLINETQNLNWLILTKRPENVCQMIEDSTGLSAFHWLFQRPYVWIGTSIETQKTASSRLVELRRIPAHIRFVSAEPLLEPIDLSISIGKRMNDGLCLPNRAGEPMELYSCIMCQGTGKNNFIETIDCQSCNGTGTFIDWLIIGGESGPEARIMPYNALVYLYQQALRLKIPLFFKQWGEYIPYLKGAKDEEVALTSELLELKPELLIEYKKEKIYPGANTWPGLALQELPRKARKQI